MVLKSELYGSSGEAEKTALFSCKKGDIVIVLFEALSLRSVCVWSAVPPAAHCSSVSQQFEALKIEVWSRTCAALFIIMKAIRWVRQLEWEY